MANGILYKSIILPIQQEESYTILGTVIYALIAIALLYLIYRLMKNRVSFDFKFFLQLIPFIFLGASLRAFVDHDFLARTFWLISPGIYLLIAGVFFLCLAISLLAERARKWDYWKVNFLIGFVTLLAAWLFVAEKVQLQNGKILLACLTLFLALVVLMFFIFKRLNWKVFYNRISFSAIASQIFDGGNTSVILALTPAYEKHPIPSFLIEKLGSWIFLPVKIAVVLIAVWLIYTQIKDKELRNLLLIAIAVLGFSQGLRNLISLILT